MGAGEKKPHPQPQLQPHPRPLSEWRGEWRPLFANKEGVSLVWRKALFITKKRPFRLEKGVSLILLKSYPSPSEGGDVFLPRLLLNSKTQLSLFPLTILFYPTSSVHAPLHSERGRGRGWLWTGERLPLCLCTRTQKKEDTVKMSSMWFRQDSNL